jgi:hypothetical protein
VQSGKRYDTPFSFIMDTLTQIILNKEQTLKEQEMESTWIDK